MAELKIKADSGGGTVSLKGPSTTTSNAAVQLTLPVDDGTANQYLKTDGSGALSWATVDTSIADDSIVEAKLDVSNAPTNGYFLQAQSGEGGGLTWAEASGGIDTSVLFRKTATTQGNSLPITDWEKADDTASGIIGTFDDPSSGIFTFPSTGMWHISATMSAQVNSTQANNTDLYIYLTTDNSNYTLVGMNAQGGNVSQKIAASAEYIFDVTSTTNCKCKISWGCHNGSEYIQGSSTRNYTTVRFTRLGDT